MKEKLWRIECPDNRRKVYSLNADQLIELKRIELKINFPHLHKY